MDGPTRQKWLKMIMSGIWYKYDSSIGLVDEEYGIEEVVVEIIIGVGVVDDLWKY